MSSEKITNIDNILPVNILHYSSMTLSTRENFADFVRRVRTEKGLSTQDIENRSGGKITRGYVSQIEAREATNLSTKKLRALARGLGVSEDEVFAVARGKQIHETAEFAASEFGMIYKKWTLLKEPEDKRTILNMIKAIGRTIDTFPHTAEESEEDRQPKKARQA